MPKSQLKIFLQGSAVSLLAQGINIVLGLATVYIGVRYLGPVIFGIWMVARSIMRFYNTSQCGLDNATATLIAKSHDAEEKKAILARSCIMLSLLSLTFILLTLCTLATPHIWLLIIGPTPNIIHNNMIIAIIILAVSQLLRLPSNAFCAAFIGLHQVYWERFYMVILPLSLNFIALLATIMWHGKLVMLATLTGISSLTTALTCITHLLYSHPELRFNFTQKLKPTPNYRTIFNQGSRFLLIGIAALIILDTDNIVISHSLGAIYVTRYAITAKLFLIGYAIINVINSALWPLYGKNASQSNWAWLNKTYNHLILILPILACALWLGTLLFAKPIIEFWASSAGYAGLSVVFLLGAYGFLLTLTSSNTVLLANLHLSRITIWASFFEAIINLILSLILVRYFGIAGVAFATLFANLVTVQWLLPLEIRRQSHGIMHINFYKILRHTSITALPTILLALYFYHKVGLAFVGLKIIIFMAYCALAWLFLPKDTRGHITMLIKRKTDKITL